MLRNCRVKSERYQLRYGRLVDGTGQRHGHFRKRISRPVGELCHIRVGKVGQAFELDGVDDYVETMLPSNVQHSRQLEFGTAFDHINVDFSNGVQFRRVDHL